MKRTFAAFGFAAALLTLALPTLPASAASLLMCATSRTGAALGPGQWTAPTTGTIYNLDGRGCAVIAAIDLGDASAARMIVDAPYKSLVKRAITTSTGGTNKVTLPAGAFIQSITIHETSGSSTVPTGFIQIGTTNAASDICCVTNVNLLRSTVQTISPDRIKKWSFSNTVPQDIFFDNSTGFAAGSVDVTVVYGHF